MDSKIIDFIGIGGGKCATTYLSECLRAHPKVFMSSPKEIHYFSKKYNKDFSWYINHFNKEKSDLIQGEFSTTYLYNTKVPTRIKKDLGEVKIVVSLRNPITRYYSHYKHLIRSGKLDNKYQKLDIENFNTANQKAPILIEQGKYYKHLLNYFSIFGENNIFIIIKEDLDLEPYSVISDLYSFLNVNSNFKPKIISKKVSAGFVPRYSWLENMRQKIYNFSYNNFPFIINLVKKLKLSQLYRKLNNKKEFIVTDEVKKELKKIYKQEILNIEELIGRKL